MYDQILSACFFSSSSDTDLDKEYRGVDEDGDNSDDDAAGPSTAPPPPMMTPCIYCSKQFKIRGIDRHLLKCPEKIRMDKIKAKLKQ